MCDIIYVVRKLLAHSRDQGSDFCTVPGMWFRVEILIFEKHANRGALVDFIGCTIVRFYPFVCRPRSE